MAFNLSKQSQSLPVGDASDGVRDGLEDLIDSNEGDAVADALSTDEIIDRSQSEEERVILEQAQNLPIIDELQRLLADPEYAPFADAIVKQPGIYELVTSGDVEPLRAKLEEMQLGATADQFEIANDQAVTPDQLKPMFDRLKSIIEEKNRQEAAEQQRQQSLGLRASKQAQLMPPDPSNEESKGRFINLFLEPLMGYDGEKGSEDATSEKTKQNILKMVSPSFENDAVDALEAIQSLDRLSGHEKAIRYLGYVFDSFVAPGAWETQDMEQPVMSESNPKGIIKFNLSNYIDKDKKEASITKTAADQFGQAYVLYGPSEKRICPKLRGKNMGDVVSEQICRFHCLDGLVIDDHKTICGEALWRANAMDKFSREYVNEEGETVGGYLNKRFEINRNVPEENKMRLKPGETRKPRPPSMGNMESRMQDMRNKEGEARGYAPDTNTGEPFNWAKDVDQNNVEVDQTERDRRESAMGHQSVNYSEKPPTENNPKVSFNLQSYKTAKRDQLAKEIRQTHSNEERDQLAIEIQEEHDDTCKCSSQDVTKVFNLQRHAEGVNTPIVEDGAPIEPKEDTVKQDDHISRGDKDDHETKKERIRRRLKGDPKPETDDERIKRRLKGGFNLNDHKIAEEKGVTYKGKEYEYNPWAVCHTTVDKDKDPAKYERCVRHVKEDSEIEDSDSKKKT